MKGLIGRTEALLLIFLGLFMVTFAEGDTYWLLLNPKFQWVTTIGGLGIILAGMGLFFIPADHPRPTRIGVLVVFVAMLISWDPEDAFVLPGNDLFSGPAAEQQPSRVQVEGREYVRINTAELFLVADQGEPERTALNYVVQGVCKRTPELDAKGQIALVRVAISCCLADAVGMGIRVAVDDPRKFESDVWLEVYGSLKAIEQADEKVRDLQIKGVFYTVLSQSHALVPDRIETMEQPGVPFIFEMRQEEPYAF
ncbi:MAG: hypothetical protein ACLFQR_10855 [Desulfovibrionales bacterium]